MNKIQIASDLHLDINGPDGFVLNPDADIFFCSGDVGSHGIHHVTELAKQCYDNNTSMVFVAGNHEYYGSTIQKIDSDLSYLTTKIATFFALNNKVWYADGLRVIGTPLWSDFQLNGTKTSENAKLAASRYINDFRGHIMYMTAGGNRKFTTDDCVELNVAANLFLDKELAKPFDGKTVVMTHWGCSPKSVDEKYCKDATSILLNPYFNNNMEKMIEKYEPDLWVHGHTHTSFDYMLGKTRVICNPYGYHTENTANFNQSQLHEI